jgi:hypothetical protein
LPAVVVVVVVLKWVAAATVEIGGSLVIGTCRAG